MLVVGHRKRGFETIRRFSRGMHQSALLDRNRTSEFTGLPTMKSESDGLPEIPDVSDVTDALISILQEGHFEYALIGGLAVVLQGHNRFTQDVDALVWDLDNRLEQLVQIADKRGFRLARLDGLDHVRSTRILHLLAEDGTAVDVFLGFLPFEHDVIHRAERMAIHEGLTAFVATPEDLIIMKLIASRSRDLYDVTALLELYPDIDKDRVRRVVIEYAEFLDRPEILQNLNDRVR